MSEDLKINLEKIFKTTIKFMEIAEKMVGLEGENRKKFVLSKMREKLGDLYDSYETEIETIIESVIFISKIGRKINVNTITCKSCFKF